MAIKVITGDCLEFMAAMKDQTVDAVITDPPYCSGSVGEAQRVSAPGHGLRSENVRRLGWFQGDNMGTAGLVFLLRSVAFESFRILKPTGSFLCFCDWRMVSNLQPAIESAGLRFQNLVIWDKGSMGLGTGFRSSHEIILHFTAGKPEYFDASTGNVIRQVRIRPEERQHQTEKPVELLKNLIRVVCPPGGLIVDPFSGSGSTGQAAKETERNAILIDRDRSLEAIAQARISKAEADLI